MSVQNVDFGSSFERPHDSVDASAEDGSGGGTMDIWTQDRQQKLRNLAAAAFTNASSFNIPAGIVDTQDFGVSFESGEKAQGINSNGLTLDKDGKPLSGTLTVEAAGVVFVEKTVSGSFVVAAPPPAGVQVGADLAADEYDLRFSPSINGLDYLEENIPYQHTAGTIQYGEINGTITDFDGQAMPNIAVGGSGAADVTDGDGSYKLVAPGGSTVTLRTLYNSYEFDVTLAAGETRTEDVTFPKLTIRVLDADLQPVSNAPVKIDNTTHYTGENGKVEIPDAEVRNYDVKVMERFEATDVSVGSAGQEWTYTVGPGASFGDYTSMSLGGVKISAVDADTGRAVTDLKAVERNTGVVSLSDGDGVCKILSEKVGEAVNIQVGTGDKRYRPQGIDGTMPDGSMLEVEVAVKPETQVSNK